MPPVENHCRHKLVKFAFYEINIIRLFQCQLMMVSTKAANAVTI